MSDPGDNQSDQPPGEKGGHARSLVLWPLFLLFVVYPLSVGPVARIFPKNPPAPVLGFYMPLLKTCWACPPLQAGLDWYLRKFWHVP